MAYNNVTYSGTAATFANGFTSSAFPTAGSTIAAGGSLVVPVDFLTTQNGGVSIMVTTRSTGGTTDVLLTASAANSATGLISTAHIALLLHPASKFSPRAQIQTLL